MVFARGALLDRYVLLEHAGGGGQGEVWKVADRVTGALSALKLAPLHADERRNERTRREARALARLHHPSLVSARALFEDADRGVIGVALEWVEAESLAATLARVTLDERAVHGVLFHVASALAHLHERGLVHRDVKPANILVLPAFFDDPGAPSNVKLVDLGIATGIGNPAPLTSTGLAVGTFPYMAPEVLDPSTWAAPESAPAIDVFALGVVGHQLLFGTHPSGLSLRATPGELLRAYREFRRSGERGARWAAALEAHSSPDPTALVVKRCVALDAASRFADGGEVSAALRDPSVVIRSPLV